MRVSLIAVVATALHLSNPTKSMPGHAVDPMQALAKLKHEVDAKKGEPLTDAAFDPVIDSIRTTVRTNIQESIDAVTGVVSRNVQEMKDCAADHGFAATAATAYTPAQTELDQAKTDSKTACDSAATSTQARDNAGKTLYETVKNSVGCSQTADVADVPMDALNFPLAGAGTYAQSLITQHQEWQTAAQAASTADSACTTGKQKKTEECAKVEQIAAAGKSAYDKCYNQAKGSYDTNIVSTRSHAPNSAMQSQKAMIENVESLICYIKVAIVDGSASKFECKEEGDKLICGCTDSGKEIYSGVEYNFSATAEEAEEKDTEWNDKGCSALAALDDACVVDADCESQKCTEGKCEDSETPTTPTPTTPPSGECLSLAGQPCESGEGASLSEWGDVTQGNCCTGKPTGPNVGYAQSLVCVEDSAGTSCQYYYYETSFAYFGR